MGLFIAKRKHTKAEYGVAGLLVLAIIFFALVTTRHPPHILFTARPLTAPHHSAPSLHAPHCRSGHCMPLTACTRALPLTAALQGDFKGGAPKFDIRGIFLICVGYRAAAACALCVVGCS